MSGITAEALAEFRRTTCPRCGMGSTAALREHAGGFHDDQAIIGRDVDVYFNLHKKMWSVRDRKTRRVVAHLYGIVLRDVTFRVSAAGNARVRREGRKNVHAFARGTVAYPGYGSPYCETFEVTYNPYKYTTFVRKDTEEPVHTASTAWLSGKTVEAA